MTQPIQNVGKSTTMSRQDKVARWAKNAARYLGLLIAIPTAFLVIIEITVLFSGVIARYIFHLPFVWSDELVGMLFVWLAMLGSIIAYQHNSHMRMTALLSMLTPKKREICDHFARAISLTFLLLMFFPAVEFTREEVITITPSLEISNAWRVSALPVGFGLMGILGLLQILQLHRHKAIFISFAFIFICGAVMFLMKSIFASWGNYNLVFFFIFLVVLMVFVGVPIAFSFGIATFCYLVLATRMPEIVLIGRMDEGVAYVILLAIPLFVFLGLLIEVTGMAKTMVDFLANILGHVRGGLSYVLIGAMYLAPAFLAQRQRVWRRLHRCFFQR